MSKIFLWGLILNVVIYEPEVSIFLSIAIF